MSKVTVLITAKVEIPADSFGTSYDLMHEALNELRTKHREADSNDDLGDLYNVLLVEEERP